jgi:hypothetical protein
MNAGSHDLDPAVLEGFCRRHHIARLWVFGSRANGRPRPDSDLDLLVEFEDGNTPGFAFFDMQHELSELLGVVVDLHTPRSLSPHFRERVQREAKLAYVA